MPVVFYAIDEEFAASTGDNVDTEPDKSVFDNPPNAFTNLVVTANEGDPSPYTFDIGDTYDVAYDGNGGGGVLEDAVVVRSDEAPGGGGIIVLEGTDGNGDAVQIIWTPGFNLENWYWDNYTPSAEPQFWTSDQVSTYNHSFVCFAAETVIATPSGLRRADAIRPGDRVLTLDAGLCPVLWTGTRRVSGRGRNSPVLLPPGSIGNDRPLRVSLQHRILLRSAWSELLFASHEVLVPAKALVGTHDIRFDPCPSITYVHLLLPAHHILFAAGGAPCETLLPGDLADTVLQNDLPTGLQELVYAAARPILTFREARCLIGAGPIEHPVAPAML